MPEEGRNCGCSRSCCCNNGILGGLFNGRGCNSEILFFIIVFLLLFTNNGNRCCD